MSLSTHKKHMENAGAIHRVLGGRSTILFYIYCTFFLSESDEFDEEVIYSKESPKMEEFFRDFEWELDRFVEYRLPIKKTL